MTGGGGEDYKCDNPFRDVYIYICVYIYLDSQLFRLLQRQNSKRTINRPRKILYILFLLNIPSKLYLIRHQLSK